MDFYDVIKTRRSVREYRSDPIPEDVLNQVLDAARPLEGISDEVVYRTLTRYFDRYRTLINGLFLANPSRALSSRPEDGNRP